MIKKSLFFLFYNFVVIALFFLVMEGVIRIAVPEIQPLGTDASLFKDNGIGQTRALRPNASGKSNGVKMTVDEKGFWKYRDETPDTTLRNWLMIGDSVTMGIGVPPSRSFAGLLDRASTDTMRVVNPSVLGYDVRDYYNIIRHYQNTGFSYDKLTLVWCLNDIYGGMDKEDTIGLHRFNLIRFLHQRVRSYLWLKKKLTDRPSDYFHFDISFYEENSPYLQKSVDYLRKIQNIAEEKGISFEVWIMPYLYQLTHPEETSDALKPLTQKLDKSNIPYIDFLSGLQNDPDPERFYLYGDGIHFSKKGHSRMARFYLDHLSN